MILLAPLDRQQVRDMVSGLAARHALSNEVVEGVAERAGGVPLFVEEVTRLLLERGEQGGVQAIPPTLEQSLTARLDRLGPAREVAQIGAVIGRDFSYRLLHAVAGLNDAPLNAALDQLAEADILLVQGQPPDADFRFKHALIADAAYENLLKSRRQVLHRRVAEELRKNFAATAETQPELLAHHFTQAGLIEAASEWWGRAGQRSLERSALVEAVKHFTRALAQIATLASTPALRCQEIKLQAALINPLIHVKGHAAPATTAAAERAHLLIEQAEALGEAPEDPLLSLSVLNAFLATRTVAFNGDAALALAAQYLAIAEKHRTTVHLMLAHRAIGISLVLTGDIAASRAHFNDMVALYDPAKHHQLWMQFNEDPAVHAFAFRSRANWLLGYPSAALADAKQALSSAREIGQAGTLMTAIGIAAFTHILSGSYTAANALSDELAALADEKDSAFYKAYATWLQGSILALHGGEGLHGVRILSSGITAWRSTGATLFAPMQLSHLASAYARLGQFDDAWRCIDEAMTAMEITKERWFEAEVNRIAGQIALMSPASGAVKAQSHFERALAVARQQQAKSWELRAAMSMARLWRDQGKREEARELLAPVYGWFTEGFDTRDLKEAKALLDHLEA
jgi:predicted ATPase